MHAFDTPLSAGLLLIVVMSAFLLIALGAILYLRAYILVRNAIAKMHRENYDLYASVIYPKKVSWVERGYVNTKDLGLWWHLYRVFFNGGVPVKYYGRWGQRGFRIMILASIVCMVLPIFVVALSVFWVMTSILVL